MAVEVIYIFYSYIFGLYFVSLADMTNKNNHIFHQKYGFYLFYHVWIHIYIKCIHSGPEFKATISHKLCCVLGLYFTSSRMWRLYTYFEYGSILEYYRIISIQDSIDWVESQMHSNNIHYFEYQTWNLDFHPAYNRCKPTTQILWCSNSIPYNNPPLTSSTMKSTKSTNY